jgi:hypothetical protein
MGRHAASGDDEPLSAAAVDVAASAIPRPPGSRPLPQPRGRHSVDDEDTNGEDSPGTNGDGDSAAPAAVVSSTKRENASQADLRLLRTDAALRNRVIAAVIVPFVLYCVVLLSIGRLNAFAVWVWLPMITAGVTGGLLLDGAHKKNRD